MKLIIAGSRDLFLNSTQLEHILNGLLLPRITHVICGMANGIDRCGWEFATANHIPIIEMPADWDTHGKKAGYLRNVAMAEHADAALIIWDGVHPHPDGRSSGSHMMRDIALKHRLRLIEIVIYPTPIIPSFDPTHSPGHTDLMITPEEIDEVDFKN